MLGGQFPSGSVRGCRAWPASPRPAQAERKARIESDGMADHLGWEAVAGIAGANGRLHRVRLSALLPIRKPASSQVDSAYHLAFGRAVTCQLVRDHHRQRAGLMLK